MIGEVSLKPILFIMVVTPKPVIILGYALVIAVTPVLAAIIIISVSVLIGLLP